MIVYTATKIKFNDDVHSNDIGNIIHSAFQRVTGKKTNESEVNSWINSLQYMDRVLRDNEIPDDAGISIEYHIPQTSKRVDFIITGRDSNQKESVVLVELKQWQQAEITGRDAIVKTRFKHGLQDTLHPSYQAWSYKRLLEDYNATVQENAIQLFPCAYLHNYAPDNVMCSPFYAHHIEKAPVFLKPDALKLQEFIKSHVKYGDKSQTMYRIDNGRIRPSKNLADELFSLLKGNESFVLIDDQKIVYETAIDCSLSSSEKRKNVLIVEGGPGTGKSVVAINLLVALTGKGQVVRYVTRNSAPRLVYEAKLTGNFRKSHISNMFSGSGSFHNVKTNSYDCLIVDEAHRLNEKSGLFSHLGEHQIKEIINSSKFSVFFIDEDQKVTIKDVGDTEVITNWAKKLKANVFKLTLESQFRCNGSNGYLAWLDNTLQIRSTANDFLDHQEYDFRIIDNPAELHNLILEKNRFNNKARLVAGYCWNWVSKKNPLLKDIIIGDYQATWNLAEDGQAWIIQPESAKEVGCIHTCQGLEVDYIGVIVGKDLIVRDGSVITQPAERATSDKSITGWKKRMKESPATTEKFIDKIIKNTYRTLMTRGQKGCYVYFVDEETRQYFESRLLVHSPPVGSDQKSPSKDISVNPPGVFPFRQLNIQEARPYQNCVPLYELEVAAGNFSDEQMVEEALWIELPDIFRPHPDLFVAQVKGESMNRRIPNGSWCLFRKNPTGSRLGKVVLVQYHGIGYTEYSGGYTIKVYDSSKNHSIDGTWRHESIVLRPDSTFADFEEIVITEDEAVSLNIVAELVAVLG